MDYNTKFLGVLKSHQNPASILKAALDVILQEKNYQKELYQYRDSLSREDKVLVSKCTKVLKELSIKSQPELVKALEKIAKTDPNIESTLRKQILPAIFFDRKLNNYSFIKYYQDPENSRAVEQEVVEAQQDEQSNLSVFDANFAKLEWKLEITLSTIKMRKVIRPLILLIFHTNKGVKKSMYLDINQFSEFRKNVALCLKQIHLIESIQI
ncbi:hypothetical protein pb186bvf_015246 [Paramecium bursaria]